MARITPVSVPSGVDISISGQSVNVKGSKGQLAHDVHPAVLVSHEADVVSFAAVEGADNAIAHAGTARALVKNMIEGVSQGFEKKLELVGVGYRAQAKGDTLNLTLGFSHPVDYPVPQGITVETPSQTEILVKGIDKQKVGQVAAEIRAYRSPEPYKGKGVRYADEHIVKKEAKKK